jgi:hypothetical protein
MFELARGYCDRGMAAYADTEQTHRLCGGISDHDSHRYRRNVEYRRFGIACIAAGIVDTALGNARPLPI